MLAKPKNHLAGEQTVCALVPVAPLSLCVCVRTSATIYESGNSNMTVQ